MFSSRAPQRSLDAVVRERAVAIAREAARQTGFQRAEPPAIRVLPRARADWRAEQARQQRYESLVCERLAECWLETVPSVQERVRRP